jgi:hypothetical protein
MALPQNQNLHAREGRWGRLPSGTAHPDRSGAVPVMKDHHPAKRRQHFADTA